MQPLTNQNTRLGFAAACVRASAHICGGSRGGAFGLAGWFVPVCKPRAVRHPVGIGRIGDFHTKGDTMARSARTRKRAPARAQTSPGTRTTARTQTTARTHTRSPADPRARELERTRARERTHKQANARTARSGKNAPRAADRTHALIPAASQLVETSAATARDGKSRVPKLVLSGAWLKAVGFPIGSAAVVTTDARGEITLHRLGLGLPRRLRIVATTA